MAGKGNQKRKSKLELEDDFEDVAAVGIPLDLVPTSPIFDAQITDAASSVDETFGSMSAKAVNGLNLWLSGSTYVEAAGVVGVTPQWLAQVRKSPAGQSYVNAYYAEISDLTKTLVVRALEVMRNAMASADTDLALKAAQSVMKNMGPQKESKTASSMSATELARAIIAEKEKLEAPIEINSKE